MTEDQKAAKVEYNRIWRIENRERILARNKAYYLENKERIEEYRSKHKERDAVHKRAHYDRNCEAIKARELARYYADYERIKKVNRERYQNNKETVRDSQNAKNRNRYKSDPEYRARRRASSEKSMWKFTDECTYEMIVELRTQDCFYCGGEGGSVDHLVPRCKGGEDRLDNLVPCCITCNSSKGHSDLADFYLRNEIATA